MKADRVTGTTQYTSSRDISKFNKTNNLSIDDFLAIMVAEMTNPPIGGMTDGGGGSKTDYMTQLAQLVTLEQISMIMEDMEELNILSQRNYAFDLIGQDVTVLDKNDGKISGTVTAAKYDGKFALVTVNGKEYGLGDIVEINSSSKNSNNHLNLGNSETKPNTSNNNTTAGQVEVKPKEKPTATKPSKPVEDKKDIEEGIINIQYEDKVGEVEEEDFGEGLEIGDDGFSYQDYWSNRN